MFSAQLCQMKLIRVDVLGLAITYFHADRVMTPVRTFWQARQVKGSPFEASAGSGGTCGPWGWMWLVVVVIEAKVTNEALSSIAIVFADRLGAGVALSKRDSE